MDDVLACRPGIAEPVPGGEKKVLLHSCCAPCSGELIEGMVKEGIELTIFFYNPNIHPKKEYAMFPLRYVLTPGRV